MAIRGRAAAAALVCAAALFIATGAHPAEQIPFNTRLEVQGGHSELEGTDGYVTLGGLAGVGLDRDFEDGMVFLDLAGHYSFEGDPAFNAALGYRWADWSDGVVWGVNAGLSGRNFDDNWYLWCNVGLERLSPQFDLRANGYIRCGDGIKDERCETLGFEGNSLLVATRADLGMQGFDLSIGSDAGALLTEDLYGKAEFYAFFDQSDENAIGGRATLDWRVFENVALNGWVGYDTLFGVSGLAGITLSFGGPAERSDKVDASGTGQRLIAFIERRDILPVHEDARIEGSTRQVTDENGEVLPFWHVDNTADPGGDGSFEQPFDTLAEAGAEAGITGPGDVIIFHEGDGTTTSQTDGITLQDGQFFLAGSFDRTIEFDGCFCRLSDLFPEEGRPVMTDSDGDALRLADDNTTGGYDIRGAAQQGVSGDGIDSLTMIDVGIFDSLGSGIELTNSSGTFLFRDLRLVGNNGDFPTDDAGGGMNLLGMAGEIVIEDTLCSENGVVGGAMRRYDCVEVTSGAEALDVRVSDSRFLDNWGNGFEAHAAGDGDMTVVLENSLFERNTESAVTLLVDPGAGGFNEWQVRGNAIQENGWAGIQMSKARGDGGGLRLLIEDNVIADNSTIANNDPTEASAISLALTGEETDAVIRDNLLSGHDGLGIFVVASPSPGGDAVGRLLIEGNTITGNGFGRTDDFRGGIMLVGLSRPTVPLSEGIIEATIRGNVIDGNALFGVQAFVTDGIVAPPTVFGPATMCINAQDNSGSDVIFLNEGTNQTQSTGMGSIERIAGGNLFLDPASGGNEQAITTSGTIGSRACETVQGF